MSMAMAYRMKKHMARGGVCGHGKQSCEMCHGGNMAKGGMVSDIDHDDDGMVDRIMAKRYSEGGRVANETPITADLEPNEFDDSVLRDDLEFSYTGANSGDELGNSALDDEDEDTVSRIMRSRGKK